MKYLLSANCNIEVDEEEDEEEYYEEYDEEYYEEYDEEYEEENKVRLPNCNYLNSIVIYPNLILVCKKTDSLCL